MSLVVDPPAEQPRKPQPNAQLAGWVMGYINNWRVVRDSEYQAGWDRAYKTYRGQWDPSTKQTQRQRSKVIPPGFAMAVDLTAAEIIEAIFSREQFFDVVTDGYDPQAQAEADKTRAQLTKDLYDDGIIKAVADAVFHGAIFGSGILKVNTEVKRKFHPVRLPKVDQDGKPVTGPGGGPIMELKRAWKDSAAVYLSAVEAGSFVPDPGTDDLEEMLGFAFEYPMPLHIIRQRQRDGIYFQGSVGAYHGPVENASANRTGMSLTDTSRVDTAEITEWHGFVPRRMLAGALAQSRGDDVGVALSQMPDDDMVDAIVVIANGSTVLKALENPSVMQDRACVAWQHNTLPGRFYGRSVWEAAKHTHLAQETEMRARIDLLAWASNPMYKADLTKLPPKFNFDVWPGKVWPVRGDPNEAVQEFRFADVNASTFQHMNDLQAMMQQAVGTVDSVASIRSNIRDESATGAALAVSGFIKRAKRVMYNIEAALSSAINKVLWRKMLYEPDRYPAAYDFEIKGTMSMIAREMEAQQRLGLIQFLQPGSPAQTLILKSIVKSSSDPDRLEIAAALDQMMQPDPAQVQFQQQQQALTLQVLSMQAKNLQADVYKKGADAGLAGAKELLTRVQAEVEKETVALEHVRALLDKQTTINQATQLDISSYEAQTNRMKVEKERKTATK